MIEVDELLYSLIRTQFYGCTINIMVDTGLASSHVIIQILQQNTITTVKRDVPLYVLRIGSKRSAPNIHYELIRLIGKRKNECNVKPT